MGPRRDGDLTPMRKGANGKPDPDPGLEWVSPG